MQRTLVVVRHAKAEWGDAELDIDRPLAARGRRDAPEIGRWLRDHVDRIDLLLCSPAVRAREPAALAVAELPAAPPVTVSDVLYGAAPGTLLHVVTHLSDDAATVALVG